MKTPVKYRDTVRVSAAAGVGIGIPGALSFGLDVIAMGSIWAGMTVRVAQIFGHPVDGAFATKLGIAVLSGTAGYVGGSKLAMKALHLIPGAGTIAAMGVNATLNGLFTLKLGRAMVNLFDKGAFDTHDYKTAGASLVALVVAVPTLDEIRELVEIVSDPSVMEAGKDFIDIARSAHAVAGNGAGAVGHGAGLSFGDLHGLGDYLRVGKEGFDLWRGAAVAGVHADPALVPTGKSPQSRLQRLTRDLLPSR